MASRVPETTCSARPRSASSASRCSSSSALARITPSWLLRRWNSRTTSSGTAESGVRLRVNVTSGATAHAGQFNLGLGNGDRFRLAPERVGKNTHGSAGGPDVLDLVGGDPVVDRAAADAYQLACAGN